MTGIPTDPPARHRAVAGRFGDVVHGVRDWGAPTPVPGWVARDVVRHDDALDARHSTDLLAGMEPIDELLRASGQYGPRVPVPDDAPPHERLMAFVGRDPAWRP